MAVAVAVASLPGRSGWALADAAEYLDSAMRVESGRPLPVESLRPFFLSALLTPLFRAARVFGSADGSEIVTIVTAAMIATSGFAAVATYLFAERLFGAGPAVCAGLLLAVNRVFNFWSPLVMADVPCAALVAAAATAALGAPTPRRALTMGALLGGAVLFKYQAMLPGSVLLIALPFLWRGTPKKLRLYAAVAGGLILAMFVQSTLDLVARRPFGATLHAWIRDNVVYLGIGRLAPYIRPIVGTEAIETWVRSWGIPANYSVWSAASVDSRFTMPFGHYWTRRFDLLTWIEIVFLFVGVVVSLRRRTRGAWLPALVVGAAAYALSTKGHKEFRLWLPVAPFFFTLVGLGFAESLAWILERAARTAVAVATVTLAQSPVAIVGGIPLQAAFARNPVLKQLLVGDADSLELRRTPEGKPTEKARGWRPWQLLPEPPNPRDFSGYARATDWLNENAPRGARVSAAWAWQFSFRLRPDLVVALPRVQLDRFVRATHQVQCELVALVSSLDYYVTHLSALNDSPALFDEIDAEFTTAAIFDDPVFDENLDSVVLFARRRPSDRPDPWMRVLSEEEAAEALARAPADRRVQFGTIDAGIDAPTPLVESLACDLDREGLLRGRIWARILWRVPENAAPISSAPRFQLSVTNAREERCGAGYDVGYGRVPMSQWKPGTVIEQRVPIRPPRSYVDFLATRREGAAMSLDLWMGVDRMSAGPVRRAVGVTFPRMLDTARARHRAFGDVHLGGLDLVR